MHTRPELESEIAHSSLSLNEEKNRLEQIKQLKKTKGSVGQLASQACLLGDGGGEGGAGLVGASTC